MCIHACSCVFVYACLLCVFGICNFVHARMCGFACICMFVRVLHMMYMQCVCACHAHLCDFDVDGLCLQDVFACM